MTGRWVVGSLLLAVAVAACAGGVAQPSSASLTVFGAASLRDALDAAIEAYAAVAPDVTITSSTDSSAALRTQIEQGAPADVFLSADVADPQALVDAGRTIGGVVPFATNRLAMIVPAANTAGLVSAADLGRPGLKLIAAGDQVPLTRYARQVVAGLAELPGYPADLVAAYEANIVSREDNARSVVAKVQLREADAAIVYATDAAADGLAVIPIPDEANVVATYGGVVVDATADPDQARAFLDWLAGGDGQAILSDFGFLSPAP